MMGEPRPPPRAPSPPRRLPSASLAPVECVSARWVWRPVRQGRLRGGAPQPRPLSITSEVFFARARAPEPLGRASSLGRRRELQLRLRFLCLARGARRPSCKLLAVSQSTTRPPSRASDTPIFVGDAGEKCASSIGRPRGARILRRRAYGNASLLPSSCGRLFHDDGRLCVDERRCAPLAEGEAGERDTPSPWTLRTRSFGTAFAPAAGPGEVLDRTNVIIGAVRGAKNPPRRRSPDGEG